MRVLLAALAALVMLAATGCNLSLDLGQYPYSGQRDAALTDAAADTTVDTDERDVSTPTDTGDSSDVVDAGDVRDVRKPSGKPYLIFTELMPDSSAPEGENIEYGEYIEVKNVGTAPADPRRIIIQLSGSERRIQVDPFPSGDVEREIFNGLELIEPGDYFVFIRQDAPVYNLTAALDDGTYYEYGRWFEAVPLSNSSRRLQLSYRPSEFQLIAHDAVEWASQSLIDPAGNSNATLDTQENIAWGVHPDFEGAGTNDDPANWCYHVDLLPESDVKASPGGPTPANCTREKEE
jgi:hypothetical protein